MSTMRRGILLLVLGTLLFATGDAIAKWLTATYSSAQITCIRSLCGLILVAIIAVATGRVHQLRTRRIGLHGLRAALVTLVMFGFYYALGHIPMVEVEAIGHAAPLFVALFAPHVLGERITRHHWFAILVGFIGILIMLRPDPDHFHVAHVLMLGCAAAYAILIMIARKLSATDSLLAINFYIYPLALAASGVLALDAWVPPTPFDWGLFIIFSMFATASVFAYIAGLKHVDAAVAATVDYASLVWVSIIGYSVWNEHPDGLSAFGILLIIAGGVYIVRHATRQLDETIVQTTEH